MSVVDWFVRRPVAAALLALAMTLCGWLCWRLLPVAPLPQVDFPVIVVYASLPGASPESMAATVATPLERALGGIAGISSISSSSNQGSTQIVLQFALDVDLNEAAREVQAAINLARDQLPSGMPGHPQYVKVNPSQAPIMALSLSSPSLSPARLYDLASSVLGQRLAQVSGVGEVSVAGASLPAVRVQLDPAALNHAGVALDDIRRALSQANALRPLGMVERGALRWDVQTSDPLFSAHEFSQLVVLERDGILVRLGDLATVTDSVENRYSSGFHNDHAAVILTISRQPSANIVQTIDAINAQLPRLRALMPAEAELAVVMDRSPGIRATLREAQLTLMIAVVLVVMVVWGFLGTLRTALIPSIALPVSLIGTFVVMWLFGFSLNNLSLMALIVAAGLVVDDAIVVLENVSRHLARGVPPLQAAMQGTREVGFTLLAMNVALVVVFVAILVMGGVVQKLFQEFSITLSAALLISLAVSLTLTPALCGLWLSPRTLTQPSRFQRWSEAAFAELQALYDPALDWALRHRRLTLLALLGVLGSSVWLFMQLPSTTLPMQDTGQIRGFVRGDDGMSFQVMQPKIEVFRQHILQDPAVLDVTGTSGGGGGLTNAQLTVRLKPLAERRVPAQDVVNRLRETAPKVPGARLMLMVDQDIMLSGPFSRSSHEVVLRSDSLQDLGVWANRLSIAMQELPELADVDVHRNEGTQQMVLDIDRERAAQLGVDMATIASLLNNSFSQRQVATLYDELNQYRVVMEVTPRYTEHPGVLGEMEVLTASGGRVPLSAFTTWDYGLANDRVRHDAQFASVGIGYELADGVTEEQASAAIRTLSAQLLMPTNVFIAEGGGMMDFSGSLSPPLLMLAVLLAVFFVLGILYESTLHPITILSTLPPAGIGALLALKLSATPLSLIALLGLFLLIGVVMKNAILMVDFALVSQREQGLSPMEAIRRAARLRLRPILMTNLAGLLGAVPLVLGMGEGAELRRPLGLVIVGGLAVSQFLTLFTTPVVYFYLERMRQWVLRRRVHEGAP